MEREQLDNFGSLITIKGTDQCLGDLMHFTGRGTYDPTLGLVPVTKDEADAHNKALDSMRLEGMDANCQIGQGSFAYYTGKGVVTTFLGTVVSDDVTLRGNQRLSIVFKRAGKVYRGRLSREYDSFNFRRVA